MSSIDTKSFESFELVAAILLGIGAIGVSMAGNQENLWDGQSVEAYSDAATMTTRASASFNTANTIYAQDGQLDVRTKVLIWEGMESDDQAVKDRQFAMAHWLLMSQISEFAYQELGLPADKRKAYYDGNVEPSLTNEELDHVLGTELGPEYVDKVFADSVKEFEAADVRFNEGRDSNSQGDLFSFATVILTVAMFFAGISLVFKTKIRWGFLAVSSLILAGGLGYMSTLAWA